MSVKSLSQIAKSLAEYLADSGQLSKSEQLMRNLESETFKGSKHLVAEVTTAYPLDAENRRELVAALHKKTNAESVELIEVVDQNILGGLILRTPDAELDTSIRTKLKKLKAI
ncbi:ATP synthase F1 subunit delta [Candidatus Saccharibacteria bacterium]|nr:ATP synthase F1 subunit delta [Candidatus Saccharibacteria bacterium]